MRIAVIRFPGSNCEAETLRAVQTSGAEAVCLSYRDRSLQGADAVILPGGFSYGDYLRSGAIARFSPVMDAIRAHADSGGPVLGVCNGFQILCEAGMLPGALVRNAGLRYLSRPVIVRVERNDTPFTTDFEEGESFQVPIGHGDGRYIASEEALERLEQNGQVVFRYTGSGFPGAPANPNGSAHDIAGICNRGRNVVGMMPHPERIADPIQGEPAGMKVFRSLITSLAGRHGS
jgi:phosphoribosylformylglycinamidine synthase